MGQGRIGPPRQAVDVRAFGAAGDGKADDSAAFERAAASAGPGGIVVPEGLFRLARDVVLDVPVSCAGRIEQPPGCRLVLRRNLDYPSYAAAFGPEAALERAVAGLLAAEGPASLDLRGERIALDRPLDVARWAGPLAAGGRKTIRNGTIAAAPGPGWEIEDLRSRARFDPARPGMLSGVAEIERIRPGAAVTGPGLGRGLLVGAIDRETQRARLSRPGWGDADFALYTFRRTGYALDFSGLERLGELGLEDIRLELGDLAGGVLLPARHGRLRATRLAVCAPSGAGLAALGGDGDLDLDQCRVESGAAEGALGVSGAGARLRLAGCVFEGFGVAAILGGRGNLVTGCRFAGGGTGRATALLVTRRDARLQAVGNAFDGCGIDWTDEHEPRFDTGRKAGFGGLGLLGNAFEASDVAAHESWLILRAHRRAQPIRDLAVIGNSFAAWGGGAARAETVCATGAPLDLADMRGINWHGNVCRGVEHPAANPVTREFAVKIPLRVWTLAPRPLLPFGAVPVDVVSVVGIDLRSASGEPVRDSPAAEIAPETGRVRLRFARPVSGRVRVTLRCDRPG